MKRIFIMAALTLANYCTQAQFNYNLSTQTGQVYNNLIAATNLTPNFIWDDDSYNINLPFTINIAGRPTNELNLELGIGTAFTVGPSFINGLVITDADIVDRGEVSGVASSPISYQTSGMAPNRIFKLEFKNAGFYDDANGNDYLNLQIWFYENGTIEYHYGSSQITSTNEYYLYGAGPINGFIKNYDLNTDEFEAMYYLTGNYFAPTLDSIDATGTPTASLNAPPVLGTVYRFVPKVAQGVGELSKISRANVYPTQAKNELNIDYHEQAAATFTIVTIDGRATGITGNLNTGLHKLDISQLSAGMYLLKMQNKDASGSWKFMKQ